MPTIEDLVIQALAEEADYAPDPTALVARVLGEKPRRSTWSAPNWLIPACAAAASAAIIGVIALWPHGGSDADRPTQPATRSIDNNGPTPDSWFELSLGDVHTLVPSGWRTDCMGTAPAEPSVAWMECPETDPAIASRVQLYSDAAGVPPLRSMLTASSISRDHQEAWLIHGRPERTREWGYGRMTCGEPCEQILVMRDVAIVHFPEQGVYVLFVVANNYALFDLIDNAWTE